jgi:hypothetical protein
MLHDTMNISIAAEPFDSTDARKLITALDAHLEVGMRQSKGSARTCGRNILRRASAHLSLRARKEQQSAAARCAFWTKRQPS